MSDGRLKLTQGFATHRSCRPFARRTAHQNPPRSRRCGSRSDPCVRRQRLATAARRLRTRSARTSSGRDGNPYQTDRHVRARARIHHEYGFAREASGEVAVREGLGVRRRRPAAKSCRQGFQTPLLGARPAKHEPNERAGQKANRRARHDKTYAGVQQSTSPLSFKLTPPGSATSST